MQEKCGLNIRSFLIPRSKVVEGRVETQAFRSLLSKIEEWGEQVFNETVPLYSFLAIPTRHKDISYKFL